MLVANRWSKTTLRAGIGSWHEFSTTVRRVFNLKSIFMKKHVRYAIAVLTLAAIGLPAYQAEAQDARMGVKGGINISNLYVDDISDEDARIGFNVGLYGQILSSSTFAIQPELLYSTRGTRFSTDGLVDQSAKFNLNYLDLPVLAVFKLGESAEIHLGGYGGYLLNANISYSGDLGNGNEDLDRDNFRSFDYGLAAGFGLNFNAIQIGTRYNLGLVKIADGDVAEAILGDAKHSNGQVYIALNLNHR
jgi:hypothetical protein